MQNVISYLKAQPIALLLIALPLTLAGELLHWPQSVIFVGALVSTDGESTWLEGSALLAVYVIFAPGFFLLP